MIRAVLAGNAESLAAELEKSGSHLARRANINKRDSWGRTALFFATMKNSYELCEVLLRNGAETFYKDKYGRTV
jgi:ankyrin repeat protein